MKTKCPCKEFCGTPPKLPALYESMTFEAYVPTPGNAMALAAAQRFLDCKTQGVYIYGEPGTGKTHLGVAMLHKIMATECSLKYTWTNAARLMKIERQEYETREESEDRMLRSLARKNFILLDDLSSEYVTGRSSEILYLLLNDALENARPRLFITGNNSLQFISKNISDRIASRLAGICGPENIIKMEGQDWRITGGANVRRV